MFTDIRGQGLQMFGSPGCKKVRHMFCELNYPGEVMLQRGPVCCCLGFVVVVQTLGKNVSYEGSSEK